MTYEQTINYALQITLIGMTLVFMAILVLWGLILLVVRLTNARETKTLSEISTELQPDKTSLPDQPDAQAQLAAAAGVAVAVALALQPSPSSDKKLAPPTNANLQLSRTSVASPWKTALRTAETSQSNTLGWAKAARMPKNKGNRS